MPTPLPNEVIIVGAGIAGLAAAYALKQEGITVRVLEAAGRVGGRMTSDTVGDRIVDCGAQFLSASYTVIPELARQLGLTGEMQPASRFNATIRAGMPRVMRLGSLADPLVTGLLTPRAWFGYGRKILPLSLCLRKLSLSDLSQWADFDKESVTAWAERELSREIIEYVFEPMLQGFYFQTPEETSRALALVLAAFGLKKAPVLSLAGGLGSLPEALARHVDVLLDMPVHAIHVGTDCVQVETAAATRQAAHVILAVPAPVAQQLFANPQGSPAAHLLATPYSASINVACLTDAAFCLPEQLRHVYGLLIPRQERTEIAGVGLENNKVPRSPKTGQLLNLLFSHDAATRRMSQPDGEIIAAATAAMTSYLPGLAQHLVWSRVYRWPAAEPLSPVGRATDLARYRTHCEAVPPPIVLAGDYMSMPFTDGAAESGVWAAQLVARALKHANTEG